MHASYTDASIRDVNSAFSPDQSVLNCCSTATRFQCRGRKSSPSFVWYTNRPFWQQRRCTKRLIIREDYGHEIDSTRPLVNPATHTHTHTHLGSQCPRMGLVALCCRRICSLLRCILGVAAAGPEFYIAHRRFHMARGCLAMRDVIRDAVSITKRKYVH